MTMIDQLGILYNGIKQVIDKNHTNTRSIAGKESKSKLSKLPKNEFLELVTDVYDELIRRKETNNCVPFLPKSSAYHPKRNMVRQKLSTLSQPKFTALAEDVILEITSRFPTLDSKSIGILEQSPIFNMDSRNNTRSTGSDDTNSIKTKGDSIKSFDPSRPRGKLSIPKNANLNHSMGPEDALKAPNLDVLTSLSSNESNKLSNGVHSRNNSESQKNQYSPEGGVTVNNSQISNRYEAELTISYKRILELEQALHESQTLNFQAQLKNMESNTLNVDNSDNLKRISILLEQQTKSQESYKKEVEKNRQLSQELSTALSKNQELEAQLIEIKKSRDVYLKTIEELEQKNTVLNQKIADIKMNALNSKALLNIESQNEDASMSEDLNKPILQRGNPTNSTSKYLSIITVEMRDNLENQVALLKEATHANLFKDILNQLQCVVQTCQVISNSVDKFEYDVGLNPSEMDSELITESKYFNNNLSDALSNLLNMIESYPQSPDQTWIFNFCNFGSQLVSSGNGLYSLFNNANQSNIFNSRSAPEKENAVNNNPLDILNNESSASPEEDDHDKGHLAGINKELMSNPIFLNKKTQLSKVKKQIRPIKSTVSENSTVNSTSKAPAQPNPAPPQNPAPSKDSEPSIRDSIQSINSFVPISFNSDPYSQENRPATNQSYLSYFSADSRQGDSIDYSSDNLSTVQEYADNNTQNLNSQDSKHQTQTSLTKEIEKRPGASNVANSQSNENSAKEIPSKLEQSPIGKNTGISTSYYKNGDNDNLDMTSRAKVISKDSNSSYSDEINDTLAPITSSVNNNPKPSDPVQRLSKAQKHLSDVLEVKFAVNAANNLLLHATSKEDSPGPFSPIANGAQSSTIAGSYTEIQNLLDFLKQKSQVLVDIIHKLLQNIREENWGSMVVPINDLLATGSQIVHRSKSSMRKCPSFPNRPQMEEVLLLMDKQNNNLISLRKSLNHLIYDTAHIDSEQLKNQLATYAFELAKYTKDCINFAR